jgi:ATP-binding cassette subfamily C (CFTR/MRP) protein 1
MGKNTEVDLPEVHTGSKVEDDKRTSDYEKANIASKISFWWMNKFVSAGEKLEEEQFVLPTDEKADVTYQKFASEWEKELSQPSPSLLKALYRCFKREFFIAAFFKLMWGVFLVLGAFYFVRSLVSYVEKVHLEGRTVGWIYSAFFFLDCILLSLSLQQMASRSSRLGIKVRGAVMTAIYRKANKVCLFILQKLIFLQ